MKKYRVNVNGSLYEIEIEEMAAPAKMSAAAPAAAPAAGRAGPALAGAAAHLPGRAHGLTGRRRARVWLTAPAFWCIFFKEN